MEAGRSYDFRSFFLVGFRPRTEWGAGLSRVRVPGMCFLPHRTNASRTSPRAFPFSVSS